MRLIQWRIQGRGPGDPGDPGPPLCLGKTDARRAKKIFWESAFPPPPPPTLISRSGSGTAIVAPSPCFKWNLGRSLCATSYVIVYDGSLPSPPPHPFVPYERLVVPQLLEVTQYPLDGKVRCRMLCYASYSFSHCVSRMYSWEWSVRREFSLFGKASHLTTSALDRTLSSRLYSLNSFKGWRDNTMVLPPLCSPTRSLAWWSNYLY